MAHKNFPDSSCDPGKLLRSAQTRAEVVAKIEVHMVQNERAHRHEIITVAKLLPQNRARYFYFSLTAAIVRCELTLININKH